MGGKGSWLLASMLVLACGTDDAPPGDATETDASTSASESTAGDPTTSTTTSAGTMVGTTTSDPSEESGPVADSGSETAEPTTDDGCPVGTEGCPCDAGSTCDEGLSCSDEGSCEVPLACRSIDTDPHGDEATAIVLGNVGCDSVIDLGVVGTLDGPQTDWYRYFGNEGLVLCTEQPQATVTAAIDTEVCVYMQCLEGSASGVSCAGGSAAATSPEGRPGCCGQDEAHIDDFECGGFFTPKNADVWISIASGRNDCVDYGLSYAF
ncbi:hypothetical protein [Paraliomyxa miuraensis]|uniref:hypothetical protein n=1 Tax=Paraliomyxa miuraensis TaxID=376150 RepID=UPI00224F31AC|nr:hypothetical protein [Paraliomyxa miuraensis]MCX4247743.1 hypothetical protein [Paraliomyxa miuraensis]